MKRLESYKKLLADPRMGSESSGWSVCYHGFGPLAIQMFHPFLKLNTAVCFFDGEEVQKHAVEGLGAKIFTYERIKGVRHNAYNLFDQYFFNDHANEIARAIYASGGNHIAFVPFNSTPALESFLFEHASNVLLAQDPVVVRSYFEDKLRLALHADEMGVPLPPQAQVEFFCNLDYDKLSYQYPEGFVMQVPISQQGVGTYFVFSKDEFDKTLSDEKNIRGDFFERTRVKITPFLNGPSLNSTAVVLHGAVALSPVDIQIVGDSRFVSLRGQYIGSDFSYPIDKNLQKEVHSIMKKVGRWLGQHGYRGNFGIDFLTTMNFDGSIRQIFVSEINARLVGESQYMADFMAMQDIVPLIWFHIAEYLNWEASPNEIEAYNNTVRPVRGAALILYTRKKGIFSASGGLKSGVYELPPPGKETENLKRIRDGWTLSDTKNDNEFVLTNGVPLEDTVIGHPRYGDFEIPLFYIETRESIVDINDPRRVNDRWVRIAEKVESAIGLTPTEPRSLRGSFH